MANLNHFEVARILQSDIVGPVSSGHGQIGSVQIIEDVFQKRGALASAALMSDTAVDKDLVIQAFLDVRNDRRSPDLYVADVEA